MMMDALFHVSLGVAIICLIVLGVVVWSCLRASSRADDSLNSWSLKQAQKSWSGEPVRYKPASLSTKAAKGIRPRDPAIGFHQATRDERGKLMH